MAVKMLMKGAVLPGNSTVELKDFEIPVPGHGQVLIQTKATTICGSDIRCIYREHTGKGPEGYIPGMVAGHEPCGIIVEEGEGLKRFKKGDRVIVYHISGCGVCNDCRRGYYISCINDRCGRFVLRMLYVHFRLYDPRQIECAVLSEENHFTGGGIYCHYCDFPLQNHINYY